MKRSKRSLLALGIRFVALIEGFTGRKSGYRPSSAQRNQGNFAVPRASPQIPSHGQDHPASPERFAVALTATHRESSVRSRGHFGGQFSGEWAPLQLLNVLEVCARQDANDGGR